jgi:hypothetical protein
MENQVLNPEANINYLEYFQTDEFINLSFDEQFKYLETYCKYITPYTHLQAELPYISLWKDRKQHYDWFPQQHNVSISFGLCTVRDAYTGTFKVMDKGCYIELYTNENMMMKHYNRIYELLQRFETEKWVTK